jgi:hypothetical protein
VMRAGLGTDTPQEVRAEGLHLCQCLPPRLGDPQRDDLHCRGVPRPPKPPKKPTAAKLRNWRVAIMRSRAQPIGTVTAPDRAAAEAEAVKAFDLSEE